MKSICKLAAGLLLAASVPIGAQTPRPMLDYSTAATIRDGCVAWAEERDLTIAVAVFDEAGRMITFAFMDGTSTAVADFAMWKGKSAATVGVSSKETANWGAGAPGVATWEGGVPFFTGDGALLGGVGVSGAESADDTACGVAGTESAGLVARPG